jgi:hypothetical protein
MSTTEKKYDPHLVVVWIHERSGQETVAVKEFSYKEDAEAKYLECVDRQIPKAALAKIIRAHGEG